MTGSSTPSASPLTTQPSGQSPDKRRTKLLAMALLVAGAALVFYLLKYHAGTADNLLKSNGRIEAVEIAVAAKTAGRIKELLVDEGDFVEAGQLVATVASESLEA